MRNFNHLGYTLKEYQPQNQSTKTEEVVFSFFLFIYFSVSVSEETGKTHLTSELMEQRIQQPHMTKNTYLKNVEKSTKEHTTITHNKQQEPWGRGQNLITRVVTLLKCPVFSKKVTKHAKKKENMAHSQEKEIYRSPAHVLPVSGQRGIVPASRVRRAPVMFGSYLRPNLNTNSIRIPKGFGGEPDKSILKVVSKNHTGKVLKNRMSGTCSSIYGKALQEQ